MTHDPWDREPFAEDEGRETWDPDELLARAIQRARHPGGSHLLGDWRGFYHGFRAGNEELRPEATRALKVSAFMTGALAQARRIREGKE